MESNFVLLEKLSNNGDFNNLTKPEGGSGPMLTLECLLCIQVEVTEVSKKRGLPPTSLSH